MLTPYLECGKIINAHGCRGDLKVDPWTDTPDVLAKMPRVYLDEGGTMKPLRITHASVMQGRFVMLGLEGVCDMDAADALRNRTLYAAREDFHLKEGQYFISDVIGSKALDAREGREGSLLGTVTDISPNAASSIYTIRTPDGRDVLVPAIPVFIKEVVPGESVSILPIDGMFDDNAEIVTND